VLKINILKGSSAIIAIACCSSAFAQDQSAAEGGQSGGLQEIIVTAQKKQESANSVPLSVTVASGEALAKAGISSTEDLGKIVPGFSYTESAYSTPVFTLRGIGFYETSIGAKPSVSVYVDEAPLPFSVMARGATLDLERLEVLKGPQGTLFGQNSTGGAINYIAAKPTNDFSAGFDASYGSYDAVNLGGYISGPITDTFKARFAFKTEQGGGFQKSYTRDDKLGDKNFVNGRLLLDFQPTDTVRFSLNVNGFIDKSEGMAAQLLDVRIQGNPAFGGSADALLAYPRAPYNNRAADWTPDRRPKRDNWMWQTVFRGDVDLADDVTLTSLTSYARYEHDTVIDPDGVTLKDYTYTTLGTIKAFSQELRLAASLGNVDLIVGANYNDEKVYQQDNSGPYPDTPSAYTFYGLGLGIPFIYYNQFSDQRFETKAVFGNADWTIGNFVVHGGIRYTKTRDDFAGCTRDEGFALGQGVGNLLNVVRAGAGLDALPPIPEGGCVTIDGQTLTYGLVESSLPEDNVSWRAGVDWKPRPGMLLYASASRGYKAGSYPLLSASDARQLTPVSQETVLAYEAGVKASFWNRRAQLNGAVFYYDYQDKQLKGMTIANPDIFGPLQALVNVPKSSITGGEVQLDLLPVNGLKLMFAGTYIKSKVKSSFVNYDAMGDAFNFKGEAFPYTPKWQLNGDAEYDFAVNENLSANIGASASYRSKTSAAFGNLPLFDINGYALVDLRAGVETTDNKWRAGIFVRNVFNKYYWNNTAKILDTIVRYAGTPRTIGINLSYRY